MRRNPGFARLAVAGGSVFSAAIGIAAPQPVTASTAPIVAIYAQPKSAVAADPLPSWNEGSVKSAILDFVTRVTTVGGPDFVPREDRIATFDNDGTLWTEQPLYVQLAFALERVEALAPQHPEWQSEEPFRSVLAGDVKGALASGQEGLIKLIMATHAGMTTDEFDRIVTEWLATARHPKLDRRYTDLVYQPMLELLAYLRQNDFRTFIVSGGGVEFMRTFSARVYGVPPEQVIGSTIKTKYELRHDRPVIVRLDEVDFIDDGPGKPPGIQKFIGRRPIAAFGNSDGDLEMLRWTTSGDGPRFALIVHHTDAEREFAYDRESKIGTLDKALDEAAVRGWTVASIKTDWKTIYPDGK